MSYVGDPMADIRRAIARGREIGLGPPAQLHHTPSNLVRLYTIGYEPRELERRVENRMLRRIEERTATRGEWRAWQHWLRVRYGIRPHAHAHADRRTIRAYADLTFAIQMAETSERKAMRGPILEFSWKLTGAMRLLRPEIDRVGYATRMFFDEIERWQENLAHERLEQHFELTG